MCNCTQTTDFKVALRQALAATTESQKMAVWENPDNKQIYYGTVEQAEKRLSKGLIECYFIPKKKAEKITFDIVETVPESAGPKEAIQKAEPKKEQRKSDK